MSVQVGVVLAGGRGVRLGRSKADLQFQGRTLADRAAGVLWPMCGSVLISVREGVDNPAPRFPALVDPAPPDRGPLVGIDAAFDATSGADLLVLACDYPFVDSPLLRRLVSHATEDDDLVMMTDFSGRDHPLVALWRRGAAEVVHRAVEEKRYKVRGVLADLRVRRLGPRDFQGIDLDRVLWNVNWSEDLKSLEELEG